MTRIITSSHLIKYSYNLIIVLVDGDDFYALTLYALLENSFHWIKTPGYQTNQRFGMIHDGASGIPKC